MSIREAATIFERHAVRARPECALPMNEALLEFSFPHVTRGPCHDAIFLRQSILEPAIVSATKQGKTSVTYGIMIDAWEQASPVARWILDGPFSGDGFLTPKKACEQLALAFNGNLASTRPATESLH